MAARKDEHFINFIIFLNEVKRYIMMFTGKIVKFYPYRTALAGSSTYVELSREDIEVLRKFIEDENGYKIDNHICFQTDDGKCYMYSDRTLYIGGKISVRNW